MLTQTLHRFCASCAGIAATTAASLNTARYSRAVFSHEFACANSATGVALDAALEYLHAFACSVQPCRASRLWLRGGLIVATRAGSAAGAGYAASSGLREVHTGSGYACWFWMAHAETNAPLFARLYSRWRRIGKTASVQSALRGGNCELIVATRAGCAAGAGYALCF